MYLDEKHLELQRIRKLIAIFVFNQPANGVEPTSPLWDFVDRMTTEDDDS